MLDGKTLTQHLTPSKKWARAMIVEESLRRTPAMRILWDELEKHGISQVTPQTMPGTAVAEVMESPKKKHINAHREQLAESIKKNHARVVLLIGNSALQSITHAAGIKKKRGRPFEKDGVIYLPIMTPGVLLHDDRARPAFVADVALFAEIVKAGKIPKEEGLNYRIVDSMSMFKKMLRDLQGTVSFDLETTGLYPWDEGAQVVSIGFGTREHQWCLPLNHPESPWPAEAHALMLEEVNERLESCYLVAHNGKFDSLWLRVHYDIDWRADFDTMLAHYMLDENSLHGLKILAQVYYGAPNYDVEFDEKTGHGALDKHCEYLAHDVFYTRRLKFTLGKLLFKDGLVNRVFESIMMPCSKLFTDIEYHGVFIDVDKMEDAEVHLRGELAQASRELAKYGDINWNSPKQIAKLFFDDLGIKVIDKTPTGAPSTSESVLLRIDHPAATALIKFRGADQLLKMFIDGWKPFLKNGRLHPSFKLHGTVTGRPSCVHPNLQQVPRLALIRALIRAPKGWSLIEIDLSQIEMRIAAELSGDQTLLAAFENDEDVHWLTAIREIARGHGLAEKVIETVFRHTKKKYSYGDAIKLLLKMGPERAAELDDAWKELRKKAKAINFGYLFGMWWKKFKIYARDNYGVTVTDQEAQESRKTFFSLYSALGPWHDRQRRYAKRHGCVRSLSGALRRLPAAMSNEDTPQRAEAQRQAINSPVQRFACELNLMTLLQLCEEFSFDVLRPVGTIHDAVLMEVRDDHVERVYNRALQIMQRPAMLDEFGINLRVPIKGEAKIGPWSKGVSLEKWLKAITPASSSDSKTKASTISGHSSVRKVGQGVSIRSTTTRPLTGKSTQKKTTGSITS